MLAGTNTAYFVPRTPFLNLAGTKMPDFVPEENYLLTLWALNNRIMKGLYTILLLLVSNTFMTFAWYGHLKLQEMKITDGWPLILIILLSWCLALFEYCFMVPANRIGFSENGGPFSLVQLKVIQEAISLIVFTAIVSILFKGQPLQWNHFVSFALIILAVFFAFIK